MSTTPLPGIAAETAVISSDCRRGHGDEGAVDEALSRLRKAMLDTLPRWPLDKGATFFVSFTVDREGRKELGAKTAAEQEKIDNPMMTLDLNRVREIVTRKQDAAVDAHIDELCRQVFQELDISHPAPPTVEGLKKVLRGEGCS